MKKREDDKQMDVKSSNTARFDVQTLQNPMPFSF